MTDEIRDNIGRITCIDCQYYNANADLDRVESTCKRLDHKRIKFYKPWFMSYHCGEQNTKICRDFIPNGVYKYLKEHWTDFNDWIGEISERETVALVLDDDFSVMYCVRYKDFAESTFLDEDGNLEWVEKVSCKRRKVSEKNPIGYELVHEKRY